MNGVEQLVDLLGNPLHHLQAKAHAHIGVLRRLQLQAAVQRGSLYRAKVVDRHLTCHDHGQPSP